MASLRGYPYLGPVSTQYRIPKLSSRREYFRLPYPITSGAALAVDGTNYKVSEISEKGLRLVAGMGALEIDSRIEGTLTLAMGTRCQVAGTVLRIDGKDYVVRLDRGPTSQDVMREHATCRKPSRTGNPCPPEAPRRRFHHLPWK